MTNYELNSVYYGCMIADSNRQSNHALTLWKIAERNRIKKGYRESDSQFRNNREIAKERMSNYPALNEQ